MAMYDKTIGRFHLEQIPPALRGIPQIEVAFDIDANGILNVNAKDKATNKEQSIRIEASSGLNPEEIEKMVGDAKKHEEEDRQKREEVDLKNQADQLVYQTEKNLKEFEDKLSEDDRKELQDAVDALKKANAGSSAEDIRASTDELNRVWNEIANKMYASAKSETSPQQEPDPTEKKKGGEEGEIEDADFEVVN